LSNLNKEQLEAVQTIKGPLLILAGAGSGKTTVLINRIANMIQSGINPWNILAITFTNKAAKEIQERLSSALGTDGDGVWASTFHSLGMRILMRHGAGIGIESGFTIYDTADQKTLVKEVLKELNYSEKLFPVNSVINAISGSKDKLIGPEEYAKTAEFSANLHARQLSNIYTLYQKKLRKNNAVDFDDLIVETVHLLEECPDVLDFYQRKFLYIMVDEYQDTSHSQYRLVSLLAQKNENICVVGDDDQSIYKFRGADITNILEFEKQFKNAKVIKLEQNYRSTTQILDVANEIIRNNRERKSKKLWSAKKDGTPVKLITVEHQHIEAHKIADIAESLKGEGKKYSDMAVLFRTNAQSRVLEEVFMQRGLPYKLLSGIKFYDRKEIKDIIAYLRVINNKNDDVSLRRIINEPKRGIGATTLDKMAAIGAFDNVSMTEITENIHRYETLRSAAEKIAGFASMMKKIREIADTTTVMDLVTKVLNETGYLEALKAEKTVESETRIENLKEFMGLVKEFEDNTPEGTLAEFLDGVSLVSDIDNYDEDQDAVVMMTLHSSKGLEFPVVFIAGMEEGIFPSFMSATEPGGIEEERRLCYVGVTRAKEKLFLLCTNSRSLFGSTSHNPKSRFIDEIPKDMIEIEEPVKHGIQGMDFSSKKEPATLPKVSSALFGGAKNTSPLRKTGDTNFKPGDRVSHPKFGEGMVLSVLPAGNDAKVSVAFDSVGTKNLMAALAGIKKL